MRKCTIRNMVFTIDSLIRDDFEKAGLSNYGYDFHSINMETFQSGNLSEGKDRFIEAHVSKSDVPKLKKIKKSEAHELYEACLAEHYGSKVEEKNSSTSGTGLSETKKK